MYIVSSSWIMRSDFNRDRHYLLVFGSCDQVHYEILIKWIFWTSIKRILFQEWPGDEVGRGFTLGDVSSGPEVAQLERRLRLVHLKWEVKIGLPKGCCLLQSKSLPLSSHLTIGFQNHPKDWYNKWKLNTN